jgi:hypothetical protein
MMVRGTTEPLQLASNPVGATAAVSAIYLEENYAPSSNISSANILFEHH